MTSTESPLHSLNAFYRETAIRRGQ